MAPHKHVSVFLEYPEARSTCSLLSPTACFKLIIKNHNQPDKSIEKQATHTFVSDQVDWGFSQMLPLTDVTAESGYLREDGSLVVRLELILQAPHFLSKSVSAPGLSRDLLSLLDAPGPTSDLTLRVGDRSFPVHRAILAARCPYFNTLFGSDFGDSGARELPLPDTDPDAVQLLLRCIYGDTPASPPELLLKPAAELADRWLLTETRDVLHFQIAARSTTKTVIGDLVWAEARGATDLVNILELVYLECAGEVESTDIDALADANPRLLARLLNAVTKDSRRVRQQAS